MDCRRTVERLTEYADDTLAADERAAVERHLDACGPCRHLAGFERGGRAVLRESAANLRSQPLPPGLRSRCEALAQAHRSRRRSLWALPFVPATTAALLILATAATLLSLATRRSDALLAAQLTADHSKCFKLFAPEYPADVDAHQLRSLLLERYDWDVDVPPSSAAEGVKLIGARRCLYGEGTVPHVMYRVDGREMSLFRLNDTTRASADLVTLGHRSRIWSRGGHTFVLVWPERAGDLTAATRYLMARAR